MNPNIMENKTLIYIALILSIIACGAWLTLDKSVQLGGYTAGYWDSAGGYKVDGTTIIDGDGAITLSNTLTVTGETNLDNLIFGGDITTLLYFDQQTTTAALICNSSVILFTPGVASSTLGLPVGTDLIADCLPDTGDTKDVLIWNNATATQSFTIVADTGLSVSSTILLMPYENGVATVSQDQWASIRFTNINGVTTTASINVFQNAD